MGDRERVGGVPWTLAKSPRAALAAPCRGRRRSVLERWYSCRKMPTTAINGQGRRAPSNSPPEDKFGTFDMGRPLEAGCDTLALSSALLDERSVLALRQQGVVHHRVRQDCWRVELAREFFCDAEIWPAPAARLFYFERSGLLRVEGHPAGVAGVLASPDDIPGYAEDVLQALAMIGVRVREPLGVARCDGTVTLGFDDPAAGLATLAGVAAIVPPRMKVNTHRGEAIETVYYETVTGRKRARWYDSGLKHGTAARGLNIRAEDQRLYDRSSRRLDARKVTTASVRQAFEKRFVTLAKLTEGVTVTGVPGIITKLAGRVRAGRCTVSKAERAMAAAEFLRAGHGDIYPKRTLARRRRELREEGLVVVEGELEPVDVDLGAVLEAALDRGVWGVG